MTDNVFAYNQRAWDKLVEDGNRWTIPVTSEAIERARQGDWHIVLTPNTPVPMSWFPNVSDTHRLPATETLCLASGGGQQGPLLAAAGAEVTVFDASSQQLEQDRSVAQRDQLTLKTVEGDMADLSVFSNASFDLIVHPCSNCFAPSIRPVWRECFRVLRPGGVLLAGFTNPVRFLFDEFETGNDQLRVRYSIPYSDLETMDKSDLQQHLLDKHEPLQYGHSLEDQIGGQTAAGFLISDLYEDRYGSAESDPLSGYLPTFIATRAIVASS